MHELTLAESMVEAIQERIGPARATRVFLEIGRLTCVEPEAIRFCFELCARGTSVEGAALEIEEPAGRVRCGACGVEGAAVSGPIPLCPCGSAEVLVLAGDRLRLKAVEVV